MTELANGKVPTRYELPWQGNRTADAGTDEAIEDNVGLWQCARRRESSARRVVD